MSDGGKGSNPRPFSVSQEQFGESHAQAFGEKRRWYFDKSCGCYRCMGLKYDERGMPLTMTTFIVCPDCGNKRCPKSTDHTLACTNSNEPGQKGSRYE
jgi:hypothetical protein